MKETLFDDEILENFASGMKNLRSKLHNEWKTKDTYQEMKEKNGEKLA